MRYAGMIRASVVLLASGFGSLAAQQPDSTPGAGPPDREAMRACMHAHMMRMDSLDTRLDSLTARLNRATGNARVGAMADVVNELVAQRRAMHRQMHDMMMQCPGMMPMGPMQPRRGPPPPRDPAAKPAPGAPQRP